MISTYYFKTIATSFVNTCFLFILTFPEFYSLFKNLVSHIAISLGYMSDDIKVFCQVVSV